MRAAERRLAASTANEAVAAADLYPHITISGFLGLLAGRGNLFNVSDTRAWAVTPALSWAAFDLGSARARLRGVEGVTRESVAEFEQVVLRALEETENALVNYREDQQRLVKLAEQARESSRAAAIARVRYREGAADFLALLDAERTELQAEDAVAEAEAGVFTSVIAVYKALGGIPDFITFIYTSFICHKETIVMTYRIAILAVVVAMAGATHAFAQEAGTGSRHRRSQHHSRRRHVLHRREDTQGPSFGNYDLGGSVTVNFNRYVGVEGEVSGALGVTQTLDFNGTSLNDVKTPHMLNYSGNLIVQAPTRSLGRAVRDGWHRRPEPVRARRPRHHRHRDVLHRQRRWRREVVQRPLGSSWRLPLHRGAIQG